MGGLLYLARDSPDFLFPVKELSAKMAQPTVTALQRLKKVMGYVKGTASYAVVQELEGGQGKWKNTNESYLVPESASDSDWSSEHRKSTSAGIHLVSGFFMSGSARTQRTGSLSSCEAELHAMVSTLADGIYIKRCLAFLTQVDVAHCLMTDLSSAMQFAAKQGVGKIRHLDGKILLVQQHVLAGDAFLQQLPTIWNVADICTKSLQQQCINLLLHELNVCKDGGTTGIGQDVHDEHVQRHGSQRQVVHLARNLVRVFSLRGLGPLPGATGQQFDVDGVIALEGLAQQQQCAAGGAGSADGSWMILLFTLLMSWESSLTWHGKFTGNLALPKLSTTTQVAELDTAYGEHGQQLVRLSHGLGET